MTRFFKIDFDCIARMHSLYMPAFIICVLCTSQTLLAQEQSGGQTQIQLPATTEAGAVRAYSLDAPVPSNLIFALKKNILYDLICTINIEAEIPMLDRYSLLLEYVFPWWETRNKYCQEMQEFGPEFRFWFDSWDKGSKDKMLGWFAGLYAMTAKYDFQFDTKVNYQGEYISAGISAGYVYPIKHIGHRTTQARFEFSVAAGYLQTDFRHYLPTDDYSLLIRDRYNVGRVSYFGPTKLKVSVVVPIFSEYNR